MSKLCLIWKSAVLYQILTDMGFNDEQKSWPEVYDYTPTFTSAFTELEHNNVYIQACVTQVVLF